MPERLTERSRHPRWTVIKGDRYWHAEPPGPAAQFKIDDLFDTFEEALAHAFKEAGE